MTVKELSNSQINSMIDEWIHSERDRKLMKRRLIDGITLEKLSEEFGLSIAQIKRIINKSLDVLNTKIS